MDTSLLVKSRQGCAQMKATQRDGVWREQILLNLKRHVVETELYGDEAVKTQNLIYFALVKSRRGKLGLPFEA